MKVTDAVLALVSGRIIALLMDDFLMEWGIQLGFWQHLIAWILFPFFSLFCLWIAFLIGRKFLFIYQLAKFLLVGAVATIIDLKMYEFLHWSLALLIPVSILMVKGISFLIATVIKFIGNKYWAFLKHEKEDIKKEVMQFFFVTLVGLVIDVISFYYFINITGPQFGVSTVLWVKLSVIFAGIIAAFWNFAGYKFFVFKK